MGQRAREIVFPRGRWRSWWNPAETVNGPRTLIFDRADRAGITAMLAMDTFYSTLIGHQRRRQPSRVAENARPRGEDDVNGDLLLEGTDFARLPGALFDQR